MNIFGELYEGRARVASIDAYSGRVDKSELRRDFESLIGDLKKISVIAVPALLKRCER